MALKFTKLSPTDNVTILVEDLVPRMQQAETARKLLSYGGVGGEQVGYLETPALKGAVVRLQMMGGEFCGNGSMATGAFLAWKSGLADGMKVEYALEVSGADGIVACKIERKGNAYIGTVCMPLPEAIDAVELDTDSGRKKIPYVRMPGITHLIAEADVLITPEEALRRIREWNQSIQAEALGILLFDEDGHTMRPLVYVAATDSAVWEHGCGSGTAATGCWYAVQNGKSCTGEVSQPGGVMHVHAEYAEGRIREVAISGKVEIVCRGEAYLEDGQ